MAKYGTRGQLGDGGGLAHAGGADQRGHAGGVGQAAAADHQAAAEHAQRQVARLLGTQLIGKFGDQRTRHVGLDAEPGQFAQYPRALRLAAIHVVPGQAGKLHLQHLAHAAQFGAKAGGVLRRAVVHLLRGGEGVHGHQRRHRDLRFHAARIRPGRHGGRGRPDRGERANRRRCNRPWCVGNSGYRRHFDRCRFGNDGRGHRVVFLRRHDTVPRGFADQGLVVVDGGDDLDAFGQPAGGQDHRIGTLLLAHFAHGLAHVLGNETLDLHGVLRTREWGMGNREWARADAWRPVAER